MAERRHAQRKKSFLRGCVYFNKRRGAMDCLIRDLSEAGARIIFSSAVNVPDVVELYIPQKEETIRARVKWRHGDEVGLAFPAAASRAAAAPAEAGDLAQRVAKLESEITALRRMLKQLKNERAAAGEVEAA
jgi:PilZ domain-containing protein